MPDRYLPPWALQVVGIVLFVGFCVFWAATGRESVLLVTASVSFIALGVYKGAGRDFLDRNGD